MIYDRFTGGFYIRVSNVMTSIGTVIAADETITPNVAVTASLDGSGLYAESIGTARGAAKISVYCASKADMVNIVDGINAGSDMYVRPAGYTYRLQGYATGVSVEAIRRGATYLVRVDAVVTRV